MTAGDKPISIDITMLKIEEIEHRISMEFADIVGFDPQVDSNDNFFHRAAHGEGY